MTRTAALGGVAFTFYALIVIVLSEYRVHFLVEQTYLYYGDNFKFHSN